jgi:hypothetical protein
MDDFRLEDLDSFDLLSAEKVANKYGGDKRKIGEAAQMGLINPTVAVMAGMFIDRMRNAAIKEQQSDTTVAQDVMAPATQMAGLGATPQAQTAPQMAPQTNTQMAAAPSGTVPLAKGGLSSLPVDEGMFPDEYAGGGIVAFAGLDGSFVQDDDMETRRLRETLRRKYAGIASPLGAFASVPASEIVGFQENRRTIQNLLGALPSLDKEQLQYMLANTPDITKVSSASPAVTNRNIDLSRDFKDTDTGVDLPQVKQPTAPAVSASKSKATEKAAAPAKEEASEDFLTRRQRMLREAKVSEDPFAADREALRARMDDIASQDKENKALAMIMGGLSGVGARNLAEFAQKAGTAGFGQYMKGKEKTREEQKEIDKINRDINKAEDAMKRGDVDKALEFEDKAKQREIQLRGVQAQERSAARPTSTAELLAALQSPNPAVRRAAETVLGSAKTGQVDERFLMERWDKMDRMEKFNLARQGIGYEQWAAGKRAEAAGGGTGGFKVLGKE